jgi:CHAD domain-containing protein
MASDVADRLVGLVVEYAAAQLRVVLESSAGVAALDGEAVHQTRVAIRRFRATVRTFRGVYRRSVAHELATRLHAQAVLLGRVRDLALARERWREADRSAERALGAALDEEQRRAAATLLDALGSPAQVQLTRQLHEWLAEPPVRQRSPMPDAGAARDRVAIARGRRDRAIVRALAAAEAQAPDAGVLLHSARKATRRHRYALELAAPMLPGAPETEIEHDQRLQDLLGAHQDAVTALELLTDFEAADGDSAAIARLRQEAEARRDSTPRALRALAATG